VVGEHVERGGVIYPRTIFGKSVLAHIFVVKTILALVAHGKPLETGRRETASL